MYINVNVPRACSDLCFHNLSILVDYLDAVKYVHQEVQFCHLVKCAAEVLWAAW